MYTSLPQTKVKNASVKGTINTYNYQFVGSANVLIFCKAWALVLMKVTVFTRFTCHTESRSF